MADYVIKKGDNLTKIAKRYGTTVDALVKANGIKNKNLIITGRTLNIPGQATKKASAARTATKATASKAPMRLSDRNVNRSGSKGSSKKMLPSTVTPESYKMNIGKSNLTPAQLREIAAKQGKGDKIIGTAAQLAVPGMGAFKVIKGIRAIKAAKAAGKTVKMLPAGKAAPKAIVMGPKGNAVTLARTTTRTSTAVPKSVAKNPAVIRAKANLARMEAGAKKGNVTKGELNEASTMLRAEVQSALRKGTAPKAAPKPAAKPAPKPAAKKAPAKKAPAKATPKKDLPKPKPAAKKATTSDAQQMAATTLNRVAGRKPVRRVVKVGAAGYLAKKWNEAD